MGTRVHVFAPARIDEMRDLFLQAGADVTALPGLGSMTGLPPLALARSIVEAGRAVGGFDVCHAWDDPTEGSTIELPTRSVRSTPTQNSTIEGDTSRHSLD